jgi:hypothetical protein
MILTENVMDTKVEKVVAEPAVRAPNPALAAPTPRPSSSAQKPHMMNPSNRASDTVERYHESYDMRSTVVLTIAAAAAAAARKTISATNGEKRIVGAESAAQREDRQPRGYDDYKGQH